MARLAVFSFAVLLAIAMGAVASIAFIGKEQFDEWITPKTADLKAAQAELERPLPGKPANILLLGSDYRAGDPSDDRRSDTMIVVRLDPQRETISMMSFPRDLYVEIPGHGMNRMNDAYSEGGAALSVQTIKQLTGLDMNYVANVDFRGFRGVVDALGGVYVDVDQRYYNDPEKGGGNYAAIDIQPGYQLLKGRDALAYARFRHSDTDFHRIARQQLMLASLKQQVGASRVVRNLPGLLDVVFQNIEMAAGGGTGTVSSRALLDYMRLAVALEGRNVYQIEITGEDFTTDSGMIVVQADPAKIQEAVNAFLAPDKGAQEATADQVTGEKRAPGAGDASAEQPIAELPKPADVTIEVKNGNGIAGAAGAAAGELRGLGYQVTVQPGTAGNADSATYANTRVQYKAEADRALAESVAELYDGAVAEPATPANPFSTRLLVIVGRTGSEMGSGAAGTDVPVGSNTAEINKVPEKAPPAVVTDAEYGKLSFVLAADKVKFPVLYPTVRERTSTYSEEGVRAYQIAKGQSVYGAYRLVARTAGGAYWGLQGTNWADPPILEHPTRTVERQGRTYRLYFNGTRLHMVAWRQGNGTYWVSNSVLNELSNETMLAIAQGVKPVPA